jgi:hypothetical protein
MPLVGPHRSLGPWKTAPDTFACSRQQAFQQWRTARSGREGRADCRRVRGCAYLARLNPSSATPPPDDARLVHFISSPVIVIVRC